LVSKSGYSIDAVVDSSVGDTSRKSYFISVWTISVTGELPWIARSAIADTVSVYETCVIITRATLSLAAAAALST